MADPLYRLLKEDEAVRGRPARLKPPFGAG